MKVRGVELAQSTKSSPIPKVCGVITDRLSATAVKKARTAGADLIEVRVDTFKAREIGALKKVFKEARSIGLPILLTVRSKKEGGHYTIGDKERLELFTALMPLVDAIDIELTSRRILSKVIATAKSRRKKVIVSFHDFKATPTSARIKKIIRDARAIGADITKVAFKARSTEDARRLALILLEEGKGSLIAISMGEKGRASRVTLPFMGSLLTYGTLTTSTAPGQMKIKELRRLIDAIA
ncbi:MAG: type I 3-dehydroquinate dehydratase [Deltaproteobacteria bacterium]|nr:type I 3-dehydroquinate dehydratase [Deltaproteobacteria bacterium]